MGARGAGATPAAVPLLQLLCCKLRAAREAELQNHKHRDSGPVAALPVRQVFGASTPRAATAGLGSCSLAPSGRGAGGWDQGALDWVTTWPRGAGLVGGIGAAAWRQVGGSGRAGLDLGVGVGVVAGGGLGLGFAGLLSRAKRELGEGRKVLGSELACRPKTGTTDGNFCIQYGNCENGREKTPPVFVPVPTDFSCSFFFRNSIRSVFTGFGGGRDGIFPSRFQPYKDTLAYGPTPMYGPSDAPS